MTRTTTVNEFAAFENCNTLAADTTIVHEGARIPVATLTMLSQLVCFALRIVAVHVTGYGAAVNVVGLALAALGIVAGALMFREGAKAKAFQSVALSGVAMFFWYLQLRFMADPINL